MPKMSDFIVCKLYFDKPYGKKKTNKKYTK